MPERARARSGTLGRQMFTAQYKLEITARALGNNLRGRGARQQVDVVTDAAIIQLTERLGTRAACKAVGAAQAGCYRRQVTRPAAHAAGPDPSRDRSQLRALRVQERQAILAVLHSERFVDVSPAELWVTLVMAAVRR